jgi:hypothetical protein
MFFFLNFIFLHNQYLTSERVKLEKLWMRRRDANKILHLFHHFSHNFFFQQHRTLTAHWSSKFSLATKSVLLKEDKKGTILYICVITIKNNLIHIHCWMKSSYTVSNNHNRIIKLKTFNFYIIITFKSAYIISCDVLIVYIFWNRP